MLESERNFADSHEEVIYGYPGLIIIGISYKSRIYFTIPAHTTISTGELGISLLKSYGHFAGGMASE